IPLTLQDGKGEPYHKETRYAAVNLIPMPFVSVRDRLDNRMLKGPEQPATLLLSLVHEKSPELTINLVEHKLVWKGVELGIMSGKSAIYAFCALSQNEVRCRRKRCRHCDACYLPITEH